MKCVTLVDFQDVKMISFKVKKTHKDATLPSYANPSDAGMDMHSMEDYVLKPGERKTFPLGFSAEFPQGYVAHVWDKSGLAGKFGIKTMAGVIDSGYRGEYKVVLLNTSNVNYEIKKGDKIAQLVLVQIEQARILETKNLEESTSRGQDGFGSTGR